MFRCCGTNPALRPRSPHRSIKLKGRQMSLGTILLIILILILIGALPTWPYSSGWGYYPSGGLGLILVIVLILVLLGRI
jgi:hypothetical protein